MSQIVRYQQKPQHLAVEWDDGRESEFDYLWLRDNCPTAFHPSTHERNLNLLSVDENTQPQDVTLGDNALQIKWQPDGHDSEFAFDWLRANDYTQTQDEDSERDFQHAYWDKRYLDSLITVQYDDLMGDESALLKWLLALQNQGLTLVRGMPKAASDGGGTLESLLQRISHLRETNFGVTFDVQSKPNPNNQAYTAEALPLHTDLPNQELPPGFQFLHCLQNESSGGESTFVDGFAVANKIRQTAPEHFRLLSEYDIPFRFHDTTHNLYERKPVIVLNSSGSINEINYNAHIATTFLLPKDIMRPYYLAYRHFMKTINDRELMIQFRLATGDMVAFDNRRVLHGRTEFNPATGLRHLRGCYIDRGDIKSKIRILQK